MKKRTYITLFLLTALLSGCTKDEEIVGVQPPLLAVTVTAADFSSDEGTATRATDIGYATTFAAGDRIGIFAIADDDVILDNNIPYAYDGTQWNPVDADNTIHHYNYAGVTYYAYYPYSADMDNAASEQAIIDKFTPKQDQSEKADYTASDLMTGTGVVSDAGTDVPKLALTLKHKMSVIVVDIKSNSYVTTGGYEYFEPIACSSINIGGTDVLQNNLAFISSVGVYRYIVPPGSTSYSVSVSYNAGEINEEYNYSTTVKQTSAGKYHLIKLHREEVATQRDLKVGDFYYQDGAILPGDSAFYNPASNPCIGIVFKVGAYSGDIVADYDNSISDIHAYVVALDDIPGGPWGKANDKSNTGANDLYRGYYNTKILLVYYKSLSSFAAKAADDYNMTCPLGEGKSKWYLPAEKQLGDIYALWKDGTLNFLKAGASADFYPNGSGNYWLHSSTGIASGTARVLVVHGGWVGNLYNRSNGANVRSVFTF